MEKRRTRSDAKKVDEVVDKRLYSSPLAKMHPQEFKAYLQYRFHNESFSDFLRRMYGKNRILKEMIPDMPRKRTFLAEDIEILDDLEAMDHIQVAPQHAVVKLEDPEEEEEEEEASHPAQDENDHSFSPPPSPELGEFGDMYNGHQQAAPAVLNEQAPDAEAHKKKRRRRFPLVGMKRYKKPEPGPSKKRKHGEEKSEPEDPLGARLPPIVDPIAPSPADPVPAAAVPVAAAPEAPAVPQDIKKARRTFKPKKEVKPVEPKYKRSEKSTPRKENLKAAKKTHALAPAPQNLPVQPMNHLIRGLDRINPIWWIPTMYTQLP